ncbi:MAG: nucleotidyltransferase domain-containing protein [Selenomonadaceae bacterium]|nr:nucleotidyltransferase domain-containing protein [Selenomonadaceae bacterium]MBR3723048.1 nucleotidyltransferase domain-containing protein [Selenomonadaceae bacterium]
MNSEVPKKMRNIEQISPQKQRDVVKMIEICSQDENIKKIIIFGSSVTDNCKNESDIDIYYEFKTVPRKYPTIKSHSAVFDKWDNFNVDENLKKEIYSTGVVVYESNNQ